MYKLRGVWYEEAFFRSTEEAHYELETILLDPNPVSYRWRIEPVELEEISSGQYDYVQKQVG
jgi:hypothetical protein